MEPLVTAEQMSAIDREAQEWGLPGMVLMENAGQHAFRLWFSHALSSLSETSEPGGTMDPIEAAIAVGPVVAVAGSGNNGGDALVMARAAANLGIHTTVLLVKNKLKGDAESQRTILERMGVPIVYWEEEGAEELLQEAEWIFDGIAGTGISGALRGNSLEVVEAINNSPASVLAIDVPSGVGDEFEPNFPAIVAQLTVTMGLRKRALYLPAARVAAGEILLGEPGFPLPLLVGRGVSFLATPDDLPDLLPSLPTGAHKGDRGFLGVFAGGEGTSGAAVLASRAGLHAGAGLVRLHTDPEVRAEAAVGDPAIMVASLDKGDLEEQVERYSAITVGPGWGVSEERWGILQALLESGIPGVLDADGLNTLAAFAPTGGIEFPDWVFTPHPGEAARLLRTETEEVLRKPLEAGRRLAEQFGATILLKGSTTFIFDPDGWETTVDGGHPELATAGSGDVLAGLLGGILARGAPPPVAAVAAALLHQEAGRRLAAQSGWFSASMLPELLGLLSREFTMVY